MKTVEHDFFPIYHDQDGQAYVLLGTSTGKPELRSLQENEAITLLMPEQLRAEAVVHIVAHEGFVEYRGYIVSEIETLGTDTTIAAS
jgi:hypothetical protein